MFSTSDGVGAGGDTVKEPPRLAFGEREGAVVSAVLTLYLKTNKKVKYKERNIPWGLRLGPIPRSLISTVRHPRCK